MARNMEISRRKKPTPSLFNGKVCRVPRGPCVRDVVGGGVINNKVQLHYWGALKSHDEQYEGN